MHCESLVLLALLLNPGPGQSPPNTQPPAALNASKKSKGLVRLTGDLTGSRGRLTYDLAGRDLYFNWVWNTSGPKPKQFSNQTESTSFWPTDVIGAGPGRIAVAGKRRARTIVELWEFENVPVPVPFVDVGTGEYVYPELRVPIDSKRIVYDEAVIGRDVVRMLFNVPVTASGVDASFLAQFHDSRDVYQLDLMSDDSTAYTLIASPTASGGAMVVPALADDEYVTRWAANHPTRGYVYGWATDPHNYDPSKQNPDTLVLYDSDRDGTLDGFLLLGHAAWYGPEAWHDADNYLEWY